MEIKPGQKVAVFSFLLLFLSPGVLASTPAHAAPSHMAPLSHYNGIVMKFTTQSIHLSLSPVKSTTVQPAIQQDPCLTNGAVNLSAIDTNRFHVNSPATNACGTAMVRGDITVRRRQTCGGQYSNPPSLVVNIPNWPDFVQAVMDADVIGLCEVCTNGVPTGFPPITVYGFEFAHAYTPNNTVYAYLDTTPSGQITLPNSPTYAFPCP